MGKIRPTNTQYLNESTNSGNAHFFKRYKCIYTGTWKFWIRVITENALNNMSKIHGTNAFKLNMK